MGTVRFSGAMMIPRNSLSGGATRVHVEYSDIFDTAEGEHPSRQRIIFDRGSHDFQSGVAG